jgi:hypothetical protein
MSQSLLYHAFGVREGYDYYAFDDTTKTFTSLKTKDKAEANRLLMARRAVFWQGCKAGMWGAT